MSSGREHRHLGDRMSISMIVSLLALVVLSHVSLIGAFPPMRGVSSPSYSMQMQTSKRGVFIADNSLAKDCKVGHDGEALVEIAQGADLFVLPQGLCIDSKKTKMKFQSLGISADRLRTRDLGMLALYLLAEKYTGDTSKYASYIQSLPAEPSGVMSWTDEEVEALAKCTTRNIAGQFRAVEQDYMAVASLKAPLLPEDKFTLEEFKWAMGQVKGKHVFLGDEAVLVPGMDIISFDPLSESEPFLAGAGMFGGKVVKVQADRPYRKGDQVHMSYGLKGAAQCLEDHGVVPEVQLADCSCELVVTVGDGDKFKDDKLNLLEDHGYGPKATFDLEADTELDIDPLLMQYLRLKFIEGKDAFILEACLSGTAWEQLSQPFSKGNEVKVIDYLIETCDTQLKALTPPDLGGNPREGPMLRLLEQERGALEGTLARLRMDKETLAEGLDPREYYQERRLRELDLLRPLDEGEVILAGEGSAGAFDDDDYSVY